MSDDKQELEFRDNKFMQELDKKLDNLSTSVQSILDALKGTDLTGPGVMLRLATVEQDLAKVKTTINRVRWMAFGYGAGAGVSVVGGFWGLMKLISSL